MRGQHQVVEFRLGLIGQPDASEVFGDLLGERPELEGSMAGCGSVLARHNLDAVETQLTLFQAQAELARLTGKGEDGVPEFLKAG